MKNSKVNEFILFGVAGVCGYIVDVLVTIMISEIANAYIARIPGFIAAATTTWIFNRSITFRTKKSKHDSVVKEYIHYVSLMTFGLFANYLVYAIFITLLPTNNHSILFSIALGSLAGMVINYINSKKYIFR